MLQKATWKANQGPAHSSIWPTLQTAGDKEADDEEAGYEEAGDDEDGNEEARDEETVEEEAGERIAHLGYQLWTTPSFQNLPTKMSWVGKFCPP